jgi:hypothetical protein
MLEGDLDSLLIRIAIVEVQQIQPSGSECSIERYPKRKTSRSNGTRACARIIA